MILFLFILQTEGFTFPSLFWDHRNPIFNKDQCHPSSTMVHLHQYDLLNFVCGNSYLNAFPVDDNEYNKPDFNYNIYMTDNDTVFLNRDVQSATLFHTCNPTWNIEQQKLYLDQISYRVKKFPFYFFSVINTKPNATHSMRITAVLCDPTDPLCNQQRYKLNLCDPLTFIKSTSYSESTHPTGSTSMSFTHPTGSTPMSFTPKSVAPPKLSCYPMVIQSEPCECLFKNLEYNIMSLFISALVGILLGIVTVVCFQSCTRRQNSLTSLII